MTPRTVLRDKACVERKRFLCSPTDLGFTGSPSLALRSSGKLQNLKLLIKCRINWLAWGEEAWAVCAPLRPPVIDGL